MTKNTTRPEPAPEPTERDLLASDDAEALPSPYGDDTVQEDGL